MSSIHTHYDNLKVARNAPASVIRAAYKALSQQWHPDRSDAPDSGRIMALINRSYAVLSDPEQRRAHDAWIAEQEAVAEAPLPDKDAPIWTEEPPAANHGRTRRQGLPARLWIVIAVSLSYLAWANSDAQFADDQAADIAIRIPAKDAGIEAASYAATDATELPVEPAKPREEPASDRVDQPIPKPASQQVSVDNGPVDADTSTPVEGTDAKEDSEATLVELAGPTEFEPNPQRYIVQVAVLATQQKVDELQARLRSMGMSSYTEPSATGDLIRVRVGPYRKEEGEEIRSKLNSMGLAGTILPREVRSRPVN